MVHSGSQKCSSLEKQRHTHCLFAWHAEKSARPVSACRGLNACALPERRSISLHVLVGT
jgi:hypothetical protein